MADETRVRCPDPEKPFESLLVPVDFTRNSERVAGRVVRLPLAERARVRLLHVVPTGLMSFGRRVSSEEAQRLLTEEAHALAARLPSGVVVESVVTEGVPTKVIAEHARAMGAGLIVMGRRGGNSLRDMFIGSAAERVLRRAGLPVLVVRRTPRAPYSRPALALDLDEAVNDVVPTFLRVNGSRGLVATVIHAFDMAYRRRIYSSLSFDQAESYRQRYRRYFMLEMASRLAVAMVLAAVPSKRAPTWNMHVRYGAPRTVIQKAVRNQDVDLLVLGTHAYSGIEQAFLGTVAGDVLREVSCDVLVVPQRGAGVTA